MSQYCYVCYNRGNDWLKNLAEIKSKHSGTPIIEFIRKFLANFDSQRNLNDESNCICSDCLSQIYSYDWMSLKLKEQESKLRQILLRTETKLACGRMPLEDEICMNVIRPVPKPVLLTPKNDENNAKKSKPIIIRVVKRVPFLKTKPPAEGQATKPSVATVISSGEGTSKSNLKSIQTSNLKSQKKVKVIKVQAKTCKFCDAKFKSDNLLENHMKTHTKSSGVITCHICFYQMSIDDEDAFKDHVRKHGKVPPKQCVICNEGGPENFDLRYHVQKNHSVANFLCDLCGKSFVFASALRKHHQTHVEDRPEQCSYCDKSFKTKQTLKDHILTHTETEALYSCAFCDKKFKRKDNCRAHERRHRDDTKKFKCSFCPSAFESKYDYNMHLQRKHDAEIPHDKTRK